LLTPIAARAALAARQAPSVVPDTPAGLPLHVASATGWPSLPHENAQTNPPVQLGRGLRSREGRPSGFSRGSSLRALRKRENEPNAGPVPEPHHPLQAQSAQTNPTAQSRSHRVHWTANNRPWPAGYPLAGVLPCGFSRGPRLPFRFTQRNPIAHLCSRGLPTPAGFSRGPSLPHLPWAPRSTENAGTNPIIRSPVLHGAGGATPAYENSATVLRPRSPRQLPSDRSRRLIFILVGGHFHPFRADQWPAHQSGPLRGPQDARTNPIVLGRRPPAGHARCAQGTICQNEPDWPPACRRYSARHEETPRRRTIFCVICAALCLCDSVTLFPRHAGTINR
jgi:hypothetical protein